MLTVLYFYEKPNKAKEIPTERFRDRKFAHTIKIDHAAKSSIHYT